jgi:hypothetical protein
MNGRNVRDDVTNTTHENQYPEINVLQCDELAVCHALQGGILK